MSFRVIFFSFLLLISSESFLGAQEVQPSTDSDKKIELSAEQQEFLNLPEQQRTDFFKHLDEATRLFNQKRIFECLDEIHEARKIFDKSSELFNLLGSCFVEFRDFVQARENFNKADVLSPGVTSTLFNLAEMDFVTQKWADCLSKLTAVLKLLPEKESPTRRLIEFKILLCNIALGKQDEANKLAEKYDPIDDDSPYYYYAQATLCYRDKDMTKAEEWIAMAGRVFVNPAVIAPWQDTLIEFGYIESFYGGLTKEAK